MWESIKHFDTGLFHLINQGGKNMLFDAVMPVISDIRYFLLPAVVFWFMLILKKDVKKRTVAVLILLVIATSDLVSAHVLKPFFQRPRPYHVLSEIHYYRGEWRVTPGKIETSTSTNFSLPSSHATNMFAAAVFLSWFFPGFAWLYLLLAVLVGYSRVYLGMHYPFDLIAGGVFGAAIGIFYILLAEGVIRLIQDKKESDNTHSS